MSTEKKKHVAAFVFPFASHPASLFHLVLKLARASPNTLFSFIGPEHINKPLFSKPHIPDNVKCYSSVGLHPVETTFETMGLFLQAAAENVQKGLDLAVGGTKEKVTCIIANAFVTASLVLAQQLNVPWIPLWSSASALSVYFHTHLIREKCGGENHVAAAAKDRALDFLPGLSHLRVEDLPEHVINGAEDETVLFFKTYASLGRVLPQAKAVVLSFFEELDPPLFVQDMKSKLKSMLYIGFLTPQYSLALPPPPPPPSKSTDDETGCLLWLDKQNGSRSVVYVSFGTVAIPPPDELVALAEALEATGFPFLWSLQDNLKGLLPDGFVERTSKRGKLVPWAPQAQALGHDSVGVYVTHSGFNSVSEAASNGVPMIIRPFFADQLIAARMVEAYWETGVRPEGGVFTKDGLVESLNLILVKEEGKKMREKAQKLKMTVLDAAGPNGKAARDFNTLVELVSS